MLKEISAVVVVIISMIAKLCVPDVVKSLNVKVFNLVSRTSEKRHKMVWTCKCKCRLDAGICNNKQRWNNDKCRCECIEVIDKEIFDKGFIWNPTNCECECDKSCDVGEYLDYERCKCRKRLIDKLVEECNENIDGNEINNVTLNEYKNVCESCAICIVLLGILFIISISISSVFIYFNWYLKSDTNICNINCGTKRVIY